MHASDAGGTTNEVERKYQLAPKLIEHWRGEWRARGENALPGIGYRDASSSRLGDASRIGKLERRIAQPTIQNDLRGAAIGLSTIEAAANRWAREQRQRQRAQGLISRI